MQFPIPHCSYYGRLHGRLYGDNIGIFCVDEAFKRLLDKYEIALDLKQQELLKQLKKFVVDEISKFNKDLNNIDLRLKDIESQLNNRKNKDKEVDNNSEKVDKVIIKKKKSRRIEALEAHKDR